MRRIFAALALPCLLSIAACSADQLAAAKVDAQKGCMLYGAGTALDPSLKPGSPTAQTGITNSCALVSGQSVTVSGPEGSVTVTPKP
jgi:hypothetical protein